MTTTPTKVVPTRIIQNNGQLATKIQIVYRPDYFEGELEETPKEQRLIEDPLSEEVLLGRFSDGDTIMAEADEDGKMIFRKAGMPELPEPTPALVAGLN